VRTLNSVESRRGTGNGGEGKLINVRAGTVDRRRPRKVSFGSKPFD